MGIYEQQRDLKDSLNLEGRRKRAKKEGMSLVKEHKRRPIKWNLK